jgi:2Fe-2S iron-sulfur cluster binding domain
VPVSLTVNGRTTTVPAGATIFKRAETLGIRVPNSHPNWCENSAHVATCCRLVMVHRFPRNAASPFRYSRCRTVMSLVKVARSLVVVRQSSVPFRTTSIELVCGRCHA